MALLGQTESKKPLGNDNVRRLGPRRPAPETPTGPIVGDLWYDTSTLSLKAWNGSLWVGVASGTAPVLNAGLELYHAASTPFIDWHRAANPAGDGNADFNVRIINDTNNALRLSTLSGVNTTTGGLFRIGNSYIGSHPVHGGGNWAAFGHTNREASADYQYMANSDGDTLINSGGIQRIRFFLNGATQRFQMDTNANHVFGRLAMQDNVIHLRGFSDNAHRIEYQGGGVDATVHTMNSNIRFATTSQYVIQFTSGGEVIARFQDGNSQTRLGSWPANGVFGGLFNQIRLNQNGNHYLHMHAANDNNTFITCNGGGSGGAGAVFFRLGNNGTTIMTIGNANQGTGAGNICMGLPNGIAGDTVFRAGGSGQIGINVSSGKHKTNVRTLRETPDPDAGPDNPIFKLRPVRFKWKNRNKENTEGLINADEINGRFPNGVAGLIAEEVREICPDAVNIWPAKPEWHWQEGDPMPETDSETGEPILYRPATPEVVTSIDNDRMVAYLVDAVQHVKEELDLSHDQIKLLKEEIKNLKKV